jgi:hypothetical protein
MACSLAASLRWLLFLACGCSMCDSYERYCHSQRSCTNPGLDADDQLLCPCRCGIGLSVMMIRRILCAVSLLFDITHTRGPGTARCVLAIRFPSNRRSGCCNGITTPITRALLTFKGKTSRRCVYCLQHQIYVPFGSHMRDNISLTQFIR